MKIKSPGILLLVAAIIMITYSFCRKKNDPNPQPYSVIPDTIMTVKGKVVDETGAPVIGATANIGSFSATSVTSGNLTLSNAPFSTRSFIKISSTGSFDAYRGFQAYQSKTNYVNAMLLAKGTPQNFSSSSETTLRNASGELTISANTLADASGNAYSGSVTAYIRFINPDNANFSYLMQGGDFLGVNSLGQTGSLTSYGFFAIELYGSAGEKLNLKSGAQAGFILPIASSQTGTATANKKLWSFDVSISKWKEEGSATRVGNNYVGTVSHFSEWNCDDWDALATITGTVICNSTPKDNEEIKLQNNANTLNTRTSSTGQFSFVIPASFPTTVIIPGIAPINIGALTEGQIYNIGVKDVCNNTANGWYTIDGVLFQASSVICNRAMGGTMIGMGDQIIVATSTNTALIYNPPASGSINVDMTTVANNIGFEVTDHNKGTAPLIVTNGTITRNGKTTSFSGTVKDLNDNTYRTVKGGYTCQ